MKKELKLKYENASKAPDEALLSIKDVKDILNIAFHSSVQRFDKLGLIKAKRNSQNYRVYSYNDVQFLIKIQKLVKFSVPLMTIKTLLEFEKSKDRDPNAFLDEFIEFYTKRYYSANRNKARKQNLKKQK